MTTPVPRPDWFLATSVPALRKTPFVKVLAPERIRVPAPDLERTPAPDRTPVNSMLPAAMAAVTEESRATAVETTWVPAVPVMAAEPALDLRVSVPPVPAAIV